MTLRVKHTMTTSNGVPFYVDTNVGADDIKTIKNLYASYIGKGLQSVTYEDASDTPTSRSATFLFDNLEIANSIFDVVMATQEYIRRNQYNADNQIVDSFTEDFLP